MLVAAHAKLLGAGLHAAAHHQPVSRLKDVQRAGYSRVGHRANEDRDVLGKTTKEERERKVEKGRKVKRESKSRRKRKRGESEIKTHKKCNLIIVKHRHGV